MATIRKRGKHWHWRGTIPVKGSDGRITRQRHEESTRTESKQRAREIAADIGRYYHDLAYGNIQKSGPTFAEAVIVYINTRGRSDRFITKLIEHFGETPLNEIDQQKATEAASKLYPGWKSSSLNRAVYTPLRSIGVKGLKRPPNAQCVLSIPDERWFDSVIAVAPPKLGALVIFLTLTGRRVGEALALTEKDVDELGQTHIGRTKTGQAVVVHLPDLCRDLIRDAPPTNSKRLFGYASLQAASVALRRVCDRAGVPYYSFHKCGRHAFATRLLKAGRSIKHVQVAGGWASPQVPMSRYMHLEQSEVQRDVEELGNQWSQKRTKP